MTFDDLIKRVATKGGITEEGTKVIENKFPEIIHEMFVKTLEKRKITTEKAQNDFNKSSYVKVPVSPMLKAESNSHCPSQ